MSGTPGSLLIVDDDTAFAHTLAEAARGRGYRADVSDTPSRTTELLAGELYDAALIDLSPGADTAFELLSQLKELSADTEVIVMSDRTSVPTTIQWFDPDAFAFVRKADLRQLFATLEQALERRRITAQNRRLVWELQTINEIASGISRSMELTEILTAALQRLARAMDGISASIRLRDRVTDRFEERAAVGSDTVRRLWTTFLPGVPRPSDTVIGTREPVIVEDLAEITGIDPADLPVRSALSVPMLAGDELLGTLSISSTRPRRFKAADQQLMTVIAAQIVVAVQHAQLHNTIRRAKREWEMTFDAISDPIAVFTDRGELLRGNRALAAHLDLPITSLRRLACGRIGFCGCIGHDRSRCAIHRALAQQASRAEITLPDGQIFSVTTFPIGSASDGPSVVQVAKNVTEEIATARRLRKMSEELATTNERLVATLDQLKATQAQLVQAEKLSAIGQLVAGVAHELNNPLTSVIGYAQLVEEELRAGPSRRPPEEVAQDLRRIAEESERAARIVRNLLTFARRQGAERAPQDLVDVCERVIALREYSFRISGLELITGFQAGVPRVLADAGQLQQVLLNLVLNAEQAMRGAVRRTLTIAVRHAARLNAVELRVSDSGHGIENGSLSRIFDPFFTTRDVGEGTGLGLSICYGIVRDHGGQIAVESRPQEGTTFSVLLPALLPEVVAGGAEILVAHPEPTEREFLTAAVRGWGYRPLPAATADAAAELWRRPALQLAIVDRSLLSADLVSWHDRGGLDRSRPVRLILTSTASDDPEREPPRRDDAPAVLITPVSLAALNDAVHAVTNNDPQPGVTNQEYA
jgi:two-component system NtrC family sensor kinase